MKPSVLKFSIIMLTANLLFGINYSYYSSLIGHALSSNDLFCLRIVADACFFIPYMLLTKRAHIDLKDLYKVGALALLLIFGRVYMMLYGMRTASPIDGSIIATMGPILIMIISAIVIKEKITAVRTAGILLGAAGSLILILSSFTAGMASGKGIGNLMIVGSVIFSSINTVFIKTLIDKYNPFTIMGWTYIIGLIIVLPLFGPGLFKIDYSSWTPKIYAELGYVLVIGTIIATALYYYGLKYISATASSMFAYSQPVIATIFAVVRGQDKITFITVGSAVLIFIGVFVVLRSFKTAPSPAENHIKNHVTN